MKYDHITINLTQYPALADQGMVTDIVMEEDRNLLLEALNFEWLPSQAEIEGAVHTLVGLAEKYSADFAMIGGAHYLTAPLDAGLRASGITPLYAFTARESTEETLLDGSVRKIQVLRHLGFVGYDNP